MRCNDGLLVWSVVLAGALERSPRQGVEADDVNYQQLPVQKSQQQHVHVGRDSERVAGEPRAQRKVDGVAVVSQRLAGNVFLS
jgi:hypothetical protein